MNAINNRGYVLQQKGDLDGALADYERAIALNPDDAYFSLDATLKPRFEPLAKEINK